VQFPKVALIVVTAFIVAGNTAEVKDEQLLNVLFKSVTAVILDGNVTEVKRKHPVKVPFKVVNEF
jgi:hypothetical protein